MIGSCETKAFSLYKTMEEPMSLDDMICKSICSFDNSDIRKKLANQIILVGGTSKLKFMVDVIED